MSGVRTTSGLGLSAVEQKHQQALHRSRVLSRTHTLSNSMLPLAPSITPCFRESLKLPSLTQTVHHQASLVPLSICEPSFFPPGQQTVFQGFSQTHRLPRRRNLSLSVGKSGENAGGPPQSYQLVYTHFSRPIKPVPKPYKPVTSAWRHTTGQYSQRPSMKQYAQTPDTEVLSVRGMPCFPRPPLSTPVNTARKQLHIFLPVEGAGEEEDKDSESIDEGFMDEVDNKVTIHKLKRGESKAPIAALTATSIGSYTSQ